MEGEGRRCGPAAVLREERRCRRAPGRKRRGGPGPCSARGCSRGAAGPERVPSIGLGPPPPGNAAGPAPARPGAAAGAPRGPSVYRASGWGRSDRETPRARTRSAVPEEAARGAGNWSWEETGEELGIILLLPLTWRRLSEVVPYLL